MNPLSSLGVGSGVLNYDIIDKLKQADENAQIAPIDKKLQENIEKQTELVGLTTMLNSLKSSSKKIADYSSYLERTATSSDESSVKVSVGAGVPVQDIKINVSEIARNSVNELGLKFASRDDIFSTSNTLFKFNINGKDYKIKINNTDTLNDVAQKIIDETNGEVNASIMKTGEGENAFSLMINSRDTGESNNIYFGNTLISRDIANGALNLVDGDFSISFVDKNGNNKIINVNLSQSNPESKQNASILKEAIINAITNDLELVELLKNGDINISLSGDGKRLILNDKRGFGISVDGIKSSELFTNKSVSEDDTIVGTNSISAGLISGVVTIGGENLDLSMITSVDNTKEMNETAIVNAINAISGYYAKINNDGFLVINTNTGEASIRAVDDNQEALKKLGLVPGDFKDWTILAPSIGIKNIQQSSNANLTYNGVNVSRPNNTIDDIINGVTLELLSPSQKDVNIRVDRNNATILEEVKAFVENYNLLIPKLDELTRYDEDTKIAGIFNGVSDIRVIKNSLHRALASINFADGRYESIVNYGLSFNDDGLLILDEGKLQSEITANPDKVMDFFRGGKATINGKEVETQGVFSLVTKELDSLTTGENARLKLFEDSITNDDKRLKADRTRNMELLNSRYEMMANRFAAYDGQIAKANNSFNSLNMMIEQSIADKKK
ncbi:hypothetical protein CCY99_06175 [Helicobacter sp. 16-1353]|uniref:flagellar filament capping protein FliD n=1 Tax=Helicobacter sp. 16-1353 TaxID=2004996 RepID=UPI000DCC8A98|nr:flagellar filament capping protein FliD [Helicobacter sp. 16-1353]RAX53177.1 hypothetical protein CCY99_06175 [Helicobacter sp. 16-1353]